ncbi:LysR substrate-binding domain-containing protein [Ramlibacter henchirensis]|nr:LysR substrate-binding domain-containing protein [Ramlibacter henchirensis]
MIKTPPSLKELPSVRQLRAFIAVYHTGNLSVAAERLALTQPAVTVLVRDLETKLGVRLFDRTTRRLRRTEAAAEAIGYAERALAELTAMGNTMAEFAGTRRGRLRISVTSTVAQTLLPEKLARFRQRHPDIKVSVDDCAPTELVDHVLSEYSDCGVGTLEAQVPGLEEKVFLRDSVVVAGTRHDLPGEARTITWKQLAALPVITVKAGYGMRTRIEQAAAAAGVELKLEHEVSLLTTALAMAAAGLGVAVVPRTILSAGAPAGLVTRALVRPQVHRTMSVIYRKDRSLSPAAQAFVRLMAG